LSGGSFWRTTPQIVMSMDAKTRLHAYLPFCFVSEPQKRPTYVHQPTPQTIAGYFNEQSAIAHSGRHYLAYGTDAQPSNG
jgi:hypothetical protein